MEGRLSNIEPRLEKLNDRNKSMINTLSAILMTIEDLKLELRQRRNEPSPVSVREHHQQPSTPKILAPSVPHSSSPGVDSFLGQIPPQSHAVILPFFTGADPIDWARQTELYFDLHDTREEFKLPLAQARLNGSHLHWFYQLRTAKPSLTWPDFKRELSVRYGHHGDPFEKLKKLRQTGLLKEYCIDRTDDVFTRRPPDRRRLLEVATAVEYEFQGAEGVLAYTTLESGKKTPARELFWVPGPRLGPQCGDGLGRGGVMGQSPGTWLMGFHAPRPPDPPLGHETRVGQPYPVSLVGFNMIRLDPDSLPPPAVPKDNLGFLPRLFRKYQPEKQSGAGNAWICPEGEIDDRAMDVNFSGSLCFDKFMHRYIPGYHQAMPFKLGDLNGETKVSGSFLRPRFDINWTTPRAEGSLSDARRDVIVSHEYISVNSSFAAFESYIIVLTLYPDENLLNWRECGTVVTMPFSVEGVELDLRMRNFEFFNLASSYVFDSLRPVHLNATGRIKFQGKVNQLFGSNNDEALQSDEHLVSPLIKCDEDTKSICGDISISGLKLNQLLLAPQLAGVLHITSNGMKLDATGRPDECLAIELVGPLQSYQKLIKPGYMEFGKMEFAWSFLAVLPRRTTPIMNSSPELITRMRKMTTCFIVLHLRLEREILIAVASHFFIFYSPNGPGYPYHELIEPSNGFCICREYVMRNIHSIFAVGRPTVGPHKTHQLILIHSSGYYGPVGTWTPRLFDVYYGGSDRDMAEPYGLFRYMPVTYSTWIAMITGYMEYGKLEFARSIFYAMPGGDQTNKNLGSETYSTHADDGYAFYYCSVEIYTGFARIFEVLLWQLWVVGINGLLS